MSGIFTDEHASAFLQPKSGKPSHYHPNRRRPLVQHKYAEAESLLRESLHLAEKQWPRAAYRFYVMSLLRAALAGQKKFAEAEPLPVEGCQRIQQRQASLPPSLDATRRITETPWMTLTCLSNRSLDDHRK